jgi:hypothetical protein
VNTHRLHFYQKSNKNAFSSFHVDVAATHFTVVPASIPHGCNKSRHGHASLCGLQPRLLQFTDSNQQFCTLPTVKNITYAVPIKKSHQARFVIGPSFDGDPRTVLLSPEECMSPFHPEEVSPERWYPPTLHKVRSHKTVISVSLYTPCNDETNVFLPNPYPSTLHFDKKDIYGLHSGGTRFESRLSYGQFCVGSFENSCNLYRKIPKNYIK